MNEHTDIFLGFDPGGNGGKRNKKGNFGWTICGTENGTGKLSVIDTGLGKNAKSVFEIVKTNIESGGLRELVRAAGIDAPLFYNRTGEDRKVDKLIRKALKCKGHHTSTVISVNNLKGACLVQGLLLADLIHREFKIPITEVHPTALKRIDESMVSFIFGLPQDKRRHERDATFAAYAAWRMHQGQEMAGWKDLFPMEPCPFLPLPQVPISYWMPIP